VYCVKNNFSINAFKEKNENKKIIGSIVLVVGFFI
jgi:hypothetical protein